MKVRKVLLLAVVVLIVTVKSFDVFATSEQEQEYVDVPLEMLREDGRHEHVQSIFEEKRIHKESKVLTQASDSSDSADGEHVDALMAMMWDWNHVMAVRLHNAT